MNNTRIRRALAFPVLPVLLWALFSGCQGGEKEPAGGLRFGYITEPGTLDPLNSSNTADGRSILFNVFEGLVKVTPGGDLAPAIAESWSVEGQGLGYNFSIREGLRFHDGSPLEAADVVFSLQTAVDAGFPGFARIAAIREGEGREVRITLKEPDPEFLPYLTIGIVPRNNTAREKRPIGSGPFKIESYTPQRSLVLARNPYYRLPEIPGLDRVTVVFLADANALLLALQGGNVDGAVVTGSMLQQLSPDKFEAVPGYSNMVQLLALNNAEAPLHLKKVREALNFAIGRQEIIDAAFFGYGEPSGSPVIPGIGGGAYEESLRDPWPCDPARAKALLAEAGYPQGFDLEITVPSSYTMHIDTAQVIAGQLAKAGVRARIRQVDWSTWLEHIYEGRRYQSTIISLDGGTASPQAFLYRYQSGQRDNFLNFRSAEFDRVYREAIKENDGDRRAALYREAQKIISREAASVYIQDIYSFQVYPRGRYLGVKTYPAGAIDFASLRRNP